MKTYYPKTKPIEASQFIANDPKTWCIFGYGEEILTILKNPIDGIGGISTGYSIWRNLEMRPATEKDGYKYYDQWIPTNFTTANGQKIMATGFRMQELRDRDYISLAKDTSIPIILNKQEFEDKWDIT